MKQKEDSAPYEQNEPDRHCSRGIAVDIRTDHPSTPVHGPLSTVSTTQAPPPAASSIAGESTTTGQDISESSSQSPAYTTASQPKCPPAHHPSAESQSPS